MTHHEDETKKRWFIGIGVGAVCAILLLWLASWAFIQALFAGIVIAILVGGFLNWRGRDDASEVSTSAPASPASAAQTATSSAAPSNKESASAGTTTAAEFVTLEDQATASAPDVSAPKAAAKEPAAVKPAGTVTAKKTAAPKKAATKTAAKSAGSASVSSDAVVAPKAKPAAKTAAKTAPAKTAKADAGETTKAKPAKAKTATAAKSKPAKAPAAAKRAPVAADGKPEMLTAPRAGTADDLKLIGGVGPKLEETLNALGVWHFDQVASWRKKEVEWVDERLRFKGRIARDGWIQQAKILAKGGETEFSRKKKKV